MGLYSLFGSRTITTAGLPLRSPFLTVNQTSLYSDDFTHVADKDWSLSGVAKYHDRAAGAALVNRMLYVDTKTWLPDDLLLKADKMTMANSVELRVPLLDHKVLEFAASLPANFKVRGFTTKYIAKRALGGLVPKEIVRRRKTGFPVPYASWLRTDLSGWLRGVILDGEALARGYFKKAGVEYLLSENSRSGAYSKELFSLAVLELWHREFVDKAPVRLAGGRLDLEERAAVGN